jgi:hypothetical protein
MSMQQVAAAQVNAEVPINECFETLEHQSVYGKAHVPTAGLTWGYYGGMWADGVSVSAGTLSLTASSTNYVVVHRTTGAITVSTSNTNWNDTATYARVYKITTSASAVSATEDHRVTTNGILAGGGGAGSGVSDGDKGDVTVSGSGATWTIDAGAVTYAKMQDVSATSRILGRKTAAAGDVEECTLSEILDFIGSAAQGDILYRGAAGWARLAAGTSGHFLQTQGAGANPQWAAGSGGASTTQTGEQIAGFIATPSNKDYKIVVKAAHGGTITETTTISASGTCTATFKINTTALGGTANSVSSTEQSQAHSSANVFSAGDDIVITVSSNATCADMSFSIKYTRTLA